MKCYSNLTSENRSLLCASCCAETKIKKNVAPPSPVKVIMVATVQNEGLRC